MKGIKYFLIVILSFAFGSQLQAQDGKRDRIVLKDGSIIVGEIIQYESGKELLFKLEMTGDTLTINESKIYKVIFSGEPLKKRKEFKPFELRSSKGYFEFSTLFMFGKDFNGKGFRASYSYSFNPLVNISLNFSLDKYEQEFDASVATISLGYRSYLDLNKIQPFVGLDAGYGFARAEGIFARVMEKEGGLMYNPYIGLQFGLANKSALSISFGYRYQKAFYLIENYDGDIVSLDHKLRRVSLNLSFFSYL
jgi:hypothetical protein